MSTSAARLSEARTPLKTQWTGVELALPRYVTSWIETRTSNSEKANLLILFDKYIPPCLEALRTRFKRITPIVDMCHVQMLCHLLRCLLTPVNTPADCSKELHEMYFVFACVWAFGAAMFQDQVGYFLRFTYVLRRDVGWM